MFVLQTHFQEISSLVDGVLEDLIPHGPSARLYDAVRWSVFAGGKRFRPVLVVTCGEAFGAKREDLLKTAAAFEMIHTYSLIHDDLPAMDDDEIRRGRATCHVKFDEATAILAGDVLQSLAFKAVAEDRVLSSETRVRVLAELAQAAAKMVDGQQLDIDAEGVLSSTESLENIHRNKTGAMISASARCGAIIGGASDSELETVTEYASALGLLFQITDDILDVTETSAGLGKTAGKDAEAEKATYPSLHGLEEAKSMALDVHASAIAALSQIARPVSGLPEIADFILTRKS